MELVLRVTEENKNCGVWIGIGTTKKTHDGITSQIIYSSLIVTDNEERAIGMHSKRISALYPNKDGWSVPEITVHKQNEFKTEVIK